MNTDNTETENEEPGTDVINYGVTDAALALLKTELADVDAAKDYESATTALKGLQQLRKKVDKSHEKQKATALGLCRRLDAEKRRVKGLIAEIEDPIKATKETVDNAAALKEQQRIDAIQERITVIRELGEDLAGRNLDNLNERVEILDQITLDSSYDEFLKDAEGTMATSRALLTIAISKEADRIAEEERLEQQRKDQEARQVEQDEKADELRKEQERLDAEQAKRDEETKKEQDRVAEENRQKQADLDAQQQKLDDEEAARKKKEQDDADAAEAEELAKRDAAEAAARAPDSAKLEVFAQQINELVSECPNMESEGGTDILADATSDLLAVAAEIRARVNEDMTTGDDDGGE